MSDCFVTSDEPPYDIITLAYPQAFIPLTNAVACIPFASQSQQHTHCRIDF